MQRKRTREQSMIYKVLYRKPKIEQHKPHLTTVDEHRYSGRVSTSCSGRVSTSCSGRESTSCSTSGTSHVTLVIMLLYFILLQENTVKEMRIRLYQNHIELLIILNRQLMSLLRSSYDVGLQIAIKSHRYQ